MAGGADGGPRSKSPRAQGGPPAGADGPRRCVRPVRVQQHVQRLARGPRRPGWGAAAPDAVVRRALRRDEHTVRVDVPVRPVVPVVLVGQPVDVHLVPVEDDEGGASRVDRPSPPCPPPAREG